MPQSILETIKIGFVAITLIVGDVVHDLKKKMKGKKEEEKK